MVIICVKRLILLETLKRFDIGEFSTRKLANCRIHKATYNTQFCYTQKIFIGDYSSATTATFVPIVGKILLASITTNLLYVKRFLCCKLLQVVSFRQQFQRIEHYQFICHSQTILPSYLLTLKFISGELRKTTELNMISSVLWDETTKS